MTIRLLVTCDTCYTQIEVEDEQSITWDFDPEWGHRCQPCSTFQAELDPDALVSLETSAAQEATACKHCAVPIFYGRSRSWREPRVHCRAAPLWVPDRVGQHHPARHLHRHGGVRPSRKFLFGVAFSEGVG